MSIVVGRERKAHDIVVLPLPDATVAAAIDVAELETAQGELDRQIAAYHRSLNRVATAVAIFGPDKQLIFFNDAFVQLWRLDSQWLKTGPSDGAVLDRLREQRKLPEVINYRDWKAKMLACCLATGEHRDTWRLPDGRTISVIAEQRPDGGVTYLYADETERVALETNYNALISVQRETLDSLKEGVAVFATDGRLKLFNSAFARIWKLSATRLIEEPHIDDIVALCRALYDEQQTWTPIARSVTSLSRDRKPVEGKMARKDQTVIEYAAMPLPDGATLLTFADVTAAKRYERALVERNEALVAADRLKNQFISHVSYELRTPLTTIIGYAEMLAGTSDALTPRQREYLSHVTASSNTLLNIIDNILDLASLDAGGVELKPARVAIRDVLSGAIEGVRDRAQAAGLVLDIALADDAHELMADEERLRQIVYNLLSNAVGFSRPGGIIQIGCWREAGSYVLEIVDQGVGIPAEQIGRVFDRFESRSRGSRHRGAGLGMSLVKSLVELHGGTVAITSVPDRGTTVTVRLPERKATLSAPAAATARLAL
jgi:signal transduction histidine kinase